MANPEFIHPMQMEPSAVLFHYDEIIKLGGLFVLQVVRDNYADKMKEFIDIDFLRNTSDEDLFYLYLARTIYNPFEWLAIKEFNYEKNYLYFWKKFKNMFISARATDIKKTVDNLVDAYFISNIYIYSKEYDKRIDFDSQSMVRFGVHREKIKYVTGNLPAVLDQINPDLVFYPNIFDIVELARLHRDIAFAVPNTAYNLTDEGELLGIDKSDNNVGIYPVIQEAKEPHYFG